MDYEALRMLVQKARNDPQFFHALVFNPESILADLGFLDRRAKAAILAVTPEQLSTLLVPSDTEKECGYTCGKKSCNWTCGEASCGHTCLNSCIATVRKIPQ